MSETEDLEAQLVALGRTLVTDQPRSDLAALVLARLTVPLEDPVDGSPEAADRSPEAVDVSPVRSGRVGRRRLGWAAAVAVVLALALIPPVRAAVVELLRIGGVVVREEPPPTTPATSGQGSTPSAPATGTTVSLERAEQLVGADLVVPPVLGTPDTVRVTHDGRVVELGWGLPGGGTRMDVLVGSLSWGYLKTVWQSVTPTHVGDHEAVWLGSSHLIEWVDRDGRTRTEPPRLAGPTLVWAVPSPTGEVTYRLEGPATLSEALRVAGSAR